MRLKRDLLVILIVFAFLLPGCAKKPEQVSESAFLMGTYVKLTAYGSEKDRETLKSAILRIEKIENILSVNREDSEVIQLNKQAGIAPFGVGNDTLYVAEKALFYAKFSGGRFDPSIGPVVKLWNIGFENEHVPDIDEIKSRLNLVDYSKVEIDTENRTVYLPKTGMLLDFGGIAKGFAADEAARILREGGIKSATVNLGGNILALGEKPDGSPWKIGVQNPFEPRGDIMGTVLVKDEAVVTSGDYERFFIKDNKRYHHILDPATGMPAYSGIKGVTIVTKLAIDADALSTSVFVMGPDEGVRFIENHNGIEGIIITQDSKVYVSSGLKDRFSIIDKNFSLQN
jgi:thiamine biosynthesis lipoprotein